MILYALIELLKKDLTLFKCGHPGLLAPTELTRLHGGGGELTWSIAAKSKYPVLMIRPFCSTDKNVCIV